MRVPPRRSRACVRFGQLRVVCAGSARALGGGSCIVSEAVASARCRPMSGAAAACCPKWWAGANAARAARSWSAVEGKGGALTSPAVAAGAWARTVSGCCALLVVLVVGGPALIVCGLAPTGVVVCAAGYGVGQLASCCIACRALVVVASGVRAATGHGRKCGPASTIRGRRGVPRSRACNVPCVLGVSVWLAVAVTRLQRWSSVCRRCRPRHAGHAPAGSRLP